MGEIVCKWVQGVTVQCYSCLALCQKRLLYCYTYIGHTIVYAPTYDGYTVASDTLVHLHVLHHTWLDFLSIVFYFGGL